jgi:hypothetical protein
MPPGVVARGATDTVAQRRHERVVRGRTDRRAALVTLVRHHHGSRDDITDGRALADGLPPPVGVCVGEEVGPDEQVSGRQDGGPWLVVGDDGGGADEVGSLVGALEVGDDDWVWWVLGGGGGGAAVWPDSGGVPVTLAGGGNCSTGTPSRSCFITAAQVAVG